MAAARREALAGPNRHQVSLLDEASEGQGHLVFAQLSGRVSIPDRGPVPP